MNVVVVEPQREEEPGLWKCFNSTCRTLALVALPSLLGCAPSSSTPGYSPEQNALISDLKEQFHVRDHKLLGDTTVILFTDIHTSDEVEETKLRIQAVNQRFPFDVFGFEGWREGVIDLAPDLESEQELKTLLTKGNPITLEELKALGFSFGQQHVKFVGYNSLIESANFTSIGLESSKSSKIESALLPALGEFYDNARTAVEKNGMFVLGVDGRWTPASNSFENAQRWMASQYPDFPLADLKAFGELRFSNVDHTVSAVVPTSVQYLHDSIARFDNWNHEHRTFKRNQEAAQIMASYLREHDLKRAGMVYGLAHSIDSGSHEDFASIQAHLALQDVGYIVIDPYPVSIERSARGIEIIVGKPPK